MRTPDLTRISCLPGDRIAAKRRAYQAKSFEYFVDCTFVELFNESCTDLLRPGSRTSYKQSTAVKLFSMCTSLITHWPWSRQSAQLQGTQCKAHQPHMCVALGTRLLRVSTHSILQQGRHSLKQSVLAVFCRGSGSE